MSKQDRYAIETEEELVKFWDHQALHNELRRQRVTTRWANKNMSQYKFLWYMIRIAKPSSILEIGCNMGGMFLLIKEVPHKYAIDVSPESIKMAQIEADKYNVDIHVSNANKLKYKDKSFDMVYSMRTLSRVPYAMFEEVISEVVRVLEDGGLFYYFEWEPYKFSDPRFDARKQELMDTKSYEFLHDITYALKNKGMVEIFGHLDGVGSENRIKCWWKPHGEY